MNKNKLKEIIREIVDRVLVENAPAPSKPKPSEKPGPVVDPGKPSTDKPKPRRTLTPDNPETLPNVNPKAQGKKTMNEEEMLKKIVDRFKSKNDETSSRS